MNASRFLATLAFAGLASTTLASSFLTEGCGGIVGEAPPGSGGGDDDGGPGPLLPPATSSTATSTATSTSTAPTPRPIPTTTATSTSTAPEPDPTPTATTTSTATPPPPDGALICGGGTAAAAASCANLGCPGDASLASALTYFCSSRFDADRATGGEMSVGCGVIETFLSEGTTSIAYDESAGGVVAVQKEPEPATTPTTCIGPTNFVFPDCDTAVLVTAASCH